MKIKHLVACIKHKDLEADVKVILKPGGDVPVELNRIHWDDVKKQLILEGDNNGL